MANAHVEGGDPDQVKTQFTSGITVRREINQNGNDLEKGKVSGPQWKPYETANRELPVTCFMPPIYYKIRWAWVQLFMKNVAFGICVGEVIVFILMVVGLAVLGYLTCCSDESTGGAATVPLALTFAFATRNSVWSFLFGISYERTLIWHKWLALFSVALGAYHGWYSRNGSEGLVTGIVLCALMGTLVVFSFFPIRRKIFEIFLKLHWLLFIGTIVMALVHGAGAAMAGAGLWAFDVLCRSFVLWRNRRNSRTVLAVRLPADVVRLTFKKNDFDYKEGQYMFICIPQVSYFEWHPFSLSSSPHQDEVSVHVRVLGDWTKRLHKVADTVEMTAFIDGPYGQPSVNIDSDRFELFLFVTGGIGITPMQSICNELIHQYLRGRPLKKVVFIWSVRDKFMVTSVLDYDKNYCAKKIPHQLPYSFSPDLITHNLGQSVMQPEFYLTRARDPSDYADANINPDLQPHLKFGRPKLPEVFEKMHALAKSSNESRVAVLSCGPARLVNDAYKLSSQFSKDGVSFEFHSELFEF